MNIHSRSIHYFDMIRRCGTIREASRKLHVASSAISRQLMTLEEEVGAPLFDRLPGGLKLTAAGEVFASHVITVLQDEQRVARELEGLKGIRRGDLSILSVEGLNSDFLPAMLELMLKRYPTVQVSIRTVGSNEIPKAIINGEADIGLGFSLPRTRDMRQVSVGKFCIGAVMPPSHPLASLAHVSFAECARYPLILSKAPLSLQATMASIILHHEKPITVLTETDSIDLMKNLSMRGIGIAFQSRLGLAYELDHQMLAHVPLWAPGPVISELGVYVRAGRSVPPVMDAFIRLISEELMRRTELEPY
jgi:DNA-binding transcriptional LysR family regulator